MKAVALLLVLLSFANSSQAIECGISFSRGNMMAVVPEGFNPQEIVYLDDFENRTQAISRGSLVVSFEKVGQTILVKAFLGDQAASSTIVLDSNQNKGHTFIEDGSKKPINMRLEANRNWRTMEGINELDSHTIHILYCRYSLIRQ